MMFTWPKLYQKELVVKLDGNLSTKLTLSATLCYIRRGRAYIEIFARAFQSIAIISWLTTKAKKVHGILAVCVGVALLVPHSCGTSNVRNEIQNIVLNLNKRKTCFP